MPKKKTFEDAMTQLEKIVQELESGDLPLEKALKKFEEGVRLSKFCFDKLEETEKKITLLTTDQNGNVSEARFPAERDEPEDE
ncbi:MAG TPA: exodeoxyribonuclease VII small subunit [Desulfosalsimonadaceae bacterium]|nr:exodeoxyribonuclease VII small subunit [Desulfosalsimonadaceae bacterium]